MPLRIQLSRRKGWRMPPNTVKVDRTTKWGNPFVVGKPGGAYSAKVMDRRHAYLLYKSASFADPPYSPKDSERYGLPYISATKVVAELARVTRCGGKIGLLHEFIPPTKRLPVKLLGIIGL